MKKVLILVLSCDLPPYRKMIETSLRTWDAVEVEGCETIYLCGESNQKSSDREVHLPVKESLYNMGTKAIQSFKYVLDNKEFDYVARVNSSCYVDKKKLVEYVQTLPETDLFCGAEVTDSPRWMWGGYQFIYTRDVLEKIVASRALWRHDVMEDKAVSFLADILKIPFTKIKGACSLNKTEKGWLCINSEDKNFEFENFEDVKLQNNQFYRVKVDGHRDVDEYLMDQLFNTLK